MLVYRCGGNRRVLVVAITSAAGVGQKCLAEDGSTRGVRVAGGAVRVARAQAAAMVYRACEGEVPEARGAGGGGVGADGDGAAGDKVEHPTEVGVGGRTAMTGSAGAR
jgi:hypothetical protein